MIDPYQVLGIERSASQDEIKKAYRTLSRKYHPDANINNPNKKQAEEKFKEIQQAYKQIMDEKENGYQSSYNTDGYGFGGDFGGFGSYSSSYGGRSETNESEEYMMHLKAASNYINNRYYKEALNVLAQMKEHGDEWYYLSAIANCGLGNNILALEHARQAAAMQPSNMQYAQLVHQLESGSNWYQDMQNPYRPPNSSACGTCMNLCFAYMCCNMCMSGTMCCSGGYYPYS